MKVKYNFNMPLVQGNESDITKDELRVVTYPDTKIDILKRDINGQWKSICKGGNVADSEIAVIPSDETNVFTEAIRLLTDFAKTSPGAWHAFDKDNYPDYVEAVATIKKYLPDTKADSLNVQANIIGYYGYENDYDGFVLVNDEMYFEIRDTGNAYTVCIVETVVPTI